jgi:predicted nuclease of predicted toxin-antitoxin system
VGVLIDENPSSRRLVARLQSAGHDVVLATDVGLVSVADARVLDWAVAQDRPVPTRDSVIRYPVFAIRRGSYFQPLIARNVGERHTKYRRRVGADPEFTFTTIRGDRVGNSFVA